MRRPGTIEKEMNSIGTLKDLTSVFESLASTQVAKVKDKVQMSQAIYEPTRRPKKAYYRT